MEKYDITKPIKLPVGMHKLNDDAGISFQLNRLVNLDGCDLEVAREDLAGDMHLGVVIRKALVAGDEELILRQVGVRLQVDAGVELRDVD